MAITMTVVTYNNSTNELENINATYLNPELFPTSGSIPESTYRTVDQVGRALCGLSNNSYRDTLINRSESTTEKLNS